MEQAEPAVIVIFGITGDLAGRYLLPSLYHLFKDGLLHDDTRIIGITRGDTTIDELFDKVELCVNEVDKTCDPVALGKMRRQTSMRTMDLGDPKAYQKLLEELEGLEAAQGSCLTRLFYLSIPPAAYHQVVTLLGKQGLNGDCAHGQASRLLLEKPFGHDLKSAQRLIDETGRSFKEAQIFRIDHYLTKATVRQILPFRRRNPQLEAAWNAGQIESVNIEAREAIGVEGRGAFYEPLGALRDFIQNHLMQVMSLVAMDLPSELDSVSVHAAKLEALKRVRPADPTQALRGQYDGYRQEVGNPDSSTETFARLTLSVDGDRWQGVPFTLLTGKSLDKKSSLVTLRFKSGELELDIQPGESIRGREELPGGNPDAGFDEPKHPDSYERVILDAIRGDNTLFATAEEIMESWRVLEPVIEAWQQGSEDLIFYKPGTDAYNIGKP